MSRTNVRAKSHKRKALRDSARAKSGDPIADELFVISHEKIPKDVFLSYIDMLTEKGYLEEDSKGEKIRFTRKYMELMGRAGGHFIEWWPTIEEEDDPRELIALEMARMVLGADMKKLIKERRLKEMGTLTGVLLRFVHMHIPDDKIDEMRSVMVHDIKLRKDRMKQNKYWSEPPSN